MEYFTELMSYNSDQQAWRRRIAQELYRASHHISSTHSQFTRSMSTSKGDNSGMTPETTGMTKKSGYSYLSAISSNPNLRRYFDQNCYMHSEINLGYSYGGRTPVKFAFKSPVIQSNPVLSRPSTAGSLRRKPTSKPNVSESSPRKDSVEKGGLSPVKMSKSVASLQSSHTRASLQSKLSSVDDVIDLKTTSSSRSQVRSKLRRSKIQCNVPEALEQSNSQALQKASVLPVFEETTQHLASSPATTTKVVQWLAEPTIPDKTPVSVDVNSQKDTLPKVDTSTPEAVADEMQDYLQDLESVRPESAATWKTSSSQKKYIGHLEMLLNEERRHRQELEAKVNALLEQRS